MSMRISSLLVGVLIIMAVALAAQAMPKPLVADTIQAFRDPGFTLPGAVFKDNAPVYVRVWDGVTTGPATTNYQADAYTGIGNMINFRVYDDGTHDDAAASDGVYHGHFTIGTAATNDSDAVNNLQVADGQGATIRSDLDGFGDWAYLNITADYVAPQEFNCSVVPNATWMGVGSQFNVTLYGEANGAAWFEYNGTNASMPNIGGNVYSFNYTVQANEAHDGVVTCWHNDTAGNENTTVTPQTLRVDTVAPVITPVWPAAGGWRNANQTNVRFNVTDPASGVGPVTVSVDGNTYNVGNAGDDYNAWNNTDFLADGVVVVVANASDNVGNNASLSWNFTVDTVAPWFVNMTSPLNMSYNTAVNFTFAPADALSPDMDCSYKLWNMAGTFGSDTAVGWVANSTENTTSQALATDRYSGNFKCIDRAGNINNTNMPDFTVDLAAPTIISVTTNDTHIGPTQGSSIVAEVTDNFGIANVTIYANGSQLSVAEEVPPADPMHYNAVFSSAVEGMYVINATANDSAGNLVFNASLQIFVDATKPSITPNLPVNGTVYNDSEIVANATANEPCEIWEFYIFNPVDGSLSAGASVNASGETSYFTTNTGTSITDGNYTVWFNCTDLAGNWNTTLNMTVFINDTTAPDAVVGLAATGGAGQIALTWWASAAPDLANYTVYRSAGSGGPYAELATTAGNAYTDNGLGFSATYYYVIAAKDVLGHVGAQSAEAGATTNAAGGGGGGSSGGYIGSRSDPPGIMVTDTVNPPVNLPEAPEEKTEMKPTPQPQAAPTEEPEVTSNLKPGRVKDETSPATGLLFLADSFWMGITALLAIACAWAVAAYARKQAKRKWYEK